jgi:hypothetical protein
LTSALLLISSPFGERMKMRGCFERLHPHPNPLPPEGEGTIDFHHTIAIIIVSETVMAGFNILGVHFSTLNDIKNLKVVNAGFFFYNGFQIPFMKGNPF